MDEVNRFLPSGYPQRELQGMFKYCDRMDGTNDDKIARRSVNNIFDIFDTDGECDQAPLAPQETKILEKQ